MSEPKITNLNSSLIEICSKYQQIVRDLQQVIQKMYLCDDEEELHNLIKESHAVYTLKLKEVDGLIQAVRAELKVKQALGISLSDILSKIVH